MRPKIYPVIHHLDDRSSLLNTQIAVEAGVDGVFIIEMDGRDQLLSPLVGLIKSKYPNLFVGVNRLSTVATESILQDIEVGANATWTDQCGVTSQRIAPFAQKIAKTLIEKPNHLFFGSVAFKYQQPEPDPAQAALKALSCGFIPTTSGAATGVAADIDEIKSMAAAVGPRKLAIASGITPENIEEYAPHLGHILVSTGISKSFYEFDPEKLNSLMAKIK